LFEVLALVVVTISVPFPVPEGDDKFNQVALSITVQFVFDVTLKLPVAPDVEATYILGGATDNVGPVPSWVTVTITELTPDAEKVTFALLGLVEVLALVVVTVIDPFPDPEPDYKLNQAQFSVTVQFVLETTLKLSNDPDE